MLNDHRAVTLPKKNAQKKKKDQKTENKSPTQELVSQLTELQEMLEKEFVFQQFMSQLLCSAILKKDTELNE